MAGRPHVKKGNFAGRAKEARDLCNVIEERRASSSDTFCLGASGVNCYLLGIESFPKRSLGLG